MEVVINKATSDLLISKLMSDKDVNLILLSYCDALGLDANKITLTGSFKLVDIEPKKDKK